MSFNEEAKRVSGWKTHGKWWDVSKLTEVFLNHKRVNVCEHTVKMVSRDSLLFHKHSPSFDWERPQWVSKCLIIFHFILSFIQRPIYFFGKSHLLLSLFLYNPNLGTFLFHVVSSLYICLIYFLLQLRR